MLDAKFYDSVGRLRLAMGHKSNLNMAGNRKSTQKGSSAEFSDFREYIPGDDLRRIDWNAYGRLDRLYVKEFMEERESVVSILIDTSQSMDYGKKNKKELAKDLMAAMAYLALNNMDRVVLYDMKHMNAPYVIAGGKRGFPQATKWIEQLEFSQSADVLNAVKHMQPKGPGATIIISDFLEEEFFDGGDQLKKVLTYLNYRKQRPIILHVFAKEEQEIDFEGTLNLIDSEVERSVKVTMEGAAIDAYNKELQSFVGTMRQICKKTKSAYAVCGTGRDFHQLIFEDLRAVYDI